MRINRFIGDFDFDSVESDKIIRAVELSDQRIVHQIRSVLRLKVGDELILCDGKGLDARARITRINAKTIDARVEEFLKNQSESSIVCILYCAVLKKDSFEWVAQKSTEVGVSHIFPVITKRTVKSSLSLTRLCAIMREAAEQSGQGRIPIITEPISFEKAIEEAPKRGIALFCDKSGSEQIASFRLGKERPAHIFIGPEGGWDPYEIDRARLSGAHIVNLGKTILRAETAAVVAAYTVYG